MLFFYCLFDHSSLDARINVVMPFFWQEEDSGVRIWRYCGIMGGKFDVAFLSRRS